MGDSSQGILQAIANAVSKATGKQDQITKQVCPTCGQEAPEDPTEAPVEE